MIPIRGATPEQLAAARNALAAAEPLRRQMQERDDAGAARWDAEIAMLARRVETACEDVDLGNGDRLAIRVALTNDETSRLEELMPRAGHEEADAEILAIMTANPILTKEWFLENRDRYGTADMAEVVVAFYEARAEKQRERFRRVAALKSFRPEPAGAGRVGVPSPDGIQGSP
jgi:hypothetical protein